MAKSNKISYLQFIGKVAKVRHATISRHGANVVYTTNIRNFRIRRYYPASRCSLDYDQLSRIAYIGGFCTQKQCPNSSYHCNNCPLDTQTLI